METSHGVIVFNSILLGRSAEGVAFSEVQSPYGREMRVRMSTKRVKGVSRPHKQVAWFRGIRRKDISKIADRRMSCSFRTIHGAERVRLAVH